MQFEKNMDGLSVRANFIYDNDLPNALATRLSIR
jgi:hypothetical protein